MAAKGHISINMQSVGNISEDLQTSRRGSIPRSERDIVSAVEDAEPFFEPDITNRIKPPKAEPENDVDENDEDDDIPYTPEARPGVDDAFFPDGSSTKPEITPLTPQDPDDIDGIETTDEMPNGGGGGHPRRRGNGPRRQFPYAPEFQPGMVNINGVQTPIPDVNVYQHKKTLAQGMMDLALLSANANQLRYVLESYKRHPYYYPSLIFICMSLFFQIAVGVGLILNSRYNVKDQKEICKANRINNFTVIGIFIVTIVNVFISAFGVADPQTDANST